MEEYGKVSAVSENRAQVQIQKKDTCGGCKVCSFGKSGIATFNSTNEVGAKVGDTVLLKLPEPKQVTASLIVYVVPLIFLFLGFLVGKLIFEEELLQYITVGVFLVISFALVFLLGKIVEKRPDSIAHIIKIVTPKNEKQKMAEEELKKSPALGGMARGAVIEQATAELVQDSEKKNQAVSQIQETQNVELINNDID